MKQFNFIDLFAGIGGFHSAMKALGGKCVMASEINEACQQTYRANFRVKNDYICGDIREVKDIPDFDVLCAGFPCQTFSKAGLQQGFKDPVRGTLFFEIVKILKSNQPKFFILENVRNLVHHDSGCTWNTVKQELKYEGYLITETPLILSPDDFGIPQVRPRVYILGIRKDAAQQDILNKGEIREEDLDILGQKKECTEKAGLDILDKGEKKYIISKEQRDMIEAWDELRRITKVNRIGAPMWLDFFGIGINDDKEFRRKVLFGLMPTWKQQFVRKNREFYISYQHIIDAWIEKYDMNSRIKIYKKFEWNCGDKINDIRECIIQIRQSGIRVKRPNYYPSLVAMVNTPIIWDKGLRNYRYITPKEAAKLQSFSDDYEFKGTDNQIYRQLGNAVNVSIIEMLMAGLFKLGKAR